MPRISKNKKEVKKEEEQKVELESYIEGISEPGMPKEERVLQIVNGWKSVDDCACSVWGSIHSSLLQGELVYAYRRTDTKSDLIQLVIVKNLPQYDQITGKEIPGSSWGYSLGMMTTGFTVLYPRLPIEYLESDVLVDMKKYKVDKELIDTYTQIINLVKEKYGEEK